LQYNGAENHCAKQPRQNATPDGLSSTQRRTHGPNLPWRVTVNTVKARAWLVATAALTLTLWPLVRSPSSDGFPLSNYPMFTVLRPDVTSIALAVGLDDNDNEITLNPSLVGGSSEVIHAVAAIGNALDQKDEAAFCISIAARVGADEHTEVVSVLILTDTYDVVDALANDAPPLDRLIHARCDVPR
jgi:hypothetical protein